ncbi:cytochrome P450 3A13-like [Anneissia japonica]|uniref:cytochrome P450 3A13-like n=1 Tax=Anneissia japonica TaxID=1529436 RepID=UPI0014257F2B|nr:cytochrome P450 3A13-like [Anneissia japonica]
MYSLLFGQLSCLFITLVFIWIYKYSIRSFTYWIKRGVPGPKPVPLIGNGFDMFFRKGFHQSHLDYILKYGPIVGVFQGRDPQLIIGDLDILRDILIKDFHHFHDHRVFIDDNFTPLNKGMIQLKGEKWKSVRSKISPTFSTSKIKMIAPLINYSCEVLSERISLAETKEIDVKQLYGCFMMDIVASTNFGLELDSLKNPKSLFIKHIKKFLNGGRNWLFALMMFPKIGIAFSSLGLKTFLKEPLDFFVNVTNQIVKAKENDSNANGINFINLMIDTNTTDIMTDVKHNRCSPPKVGLLLSTEEIVAQSLFFIVAGYDTTSTLLSCVSYLMALHPNIQDKLVSHIEEVLQGEDSVSYDAISKMKYLDQIIQETLRLYPSIPFSDRVCNSTWTSKRLTIEKGTFVTIPIWAIHHNPNIWTDPDKFDPDRFSKENKQKHHPISWIPFGHGPRSCIGIRFALTTVKYAIIHVFRKNRAVPTEKTPNAIECNDFGQVIPKSGITIRFEKRCC